MVLLGGPNKPSVTGDVSARVTITVDRTQMHNIGLTKSPHWKMFSARSGIPISSTAMSKGSSALVPAQHESLVHNRRKEPSTRCFLTPIASTGVSGCKASNLLRKIPKVYRPTVLLPSMRLGAITLSAYQAGSGQTSLLSPASFSDGITTRPLASSSEW